MRRLIRVSLSLLAASILFFSTAPASYAASGGPGVTDETAAAGSGITLEGPGQSASADAEAAQSAVISSGTVSSAGTDSSAEAAETAVAASSPTAADISSADTGADDSENAAAGTSELSEEAADELEAEQAAAEAAALKEAAGNPLEVPKRTPTLQTNILLDNALTWSVSYMNDSQITSGDDTFSSVSTWLLDIHGDILYRVYTTAGGWTDWVLNGQYTAAAGAPIEAIQYRFKGPVEDGYDLYYCAVLSDGTTTGWAKNGQTCGTMNTGLHLTGYRLLSWDKESQVAFAGGGNPLVADHADGIQTINGELRYISGSGDSFTGWAWDGNDRYYFADSYPVTGWQYIGGLKYYFDETGLLVTDVESLLETDGPYQLKINKSLNCMTVYAKDGENGFIIPVKSFLTSVGDDTPTGTFYTPEKYRWRLMIHDLYTQYATRLGPGLSFLIHSIIYDAADPFTVWASTYNNLGIARSSGCIRLASGDAKWVYDHCPLQTEVIVYEDELDPGPLERPTIWYEIPFEQTWDPTDPNVTEEMIAEESARILASFGLS